jgi:hypothetical protein
VRIKYGAQYAVDFTKDKLTKLTESIKTQELIQPMITYDNKSHNTLTYLTLTNKILHHINTTKSHTAK